MSERKAALFVIAFFEVLALDLRIPSYLLTSLSTPFLMASMCQVLRPAISQYLETTRAVFALNVEAVLLLFFLPELSFMNNRSFRTFIWLGSWHWGPVKGSWSDMSISGSRLKGVIKLSFKSVLTFPIRKWSNFFRDNFV